MPNVTLSLDKDLLEKSRKYANSRNTSLNALIREFLVETTSPSDDAVDEMVARLQSADGNSQGEKIERESLYRY